MNEQNQNQASQATPLVKTNSNPLVKVIGVLMLCALAGGGYYFFQTQSENEKAREELLEQSELIGNNTQESSSQSSSEQSEDSSSENVLNDASERITSQNSQSTSTEQNTSSTESEEVDQYLGFKIVTEADPDAQAAIDEEGRQKALESFEQELLAENSQELTESEANMSADTDNSVQAKSHDRIISARFVDGFASYLVENYSSFSKTSPMKALAFYGTQLKDLPQSAGIAQSREFIINYLYNAETLAKLHMAYEDQFLEAYKSYANAPLEDGSTLTSAQVTRMNAYYANYASSLAQALRAISTVPDFKEQMNSVYAAESALALVKASFAKTQVEFDEARYANRSTTLLGRQLKDLATEIEKSSAKLKAEEEALVGKIMQQSNVSLSTQDLSTLCRWLLRREVQLANYSAWQNTNRELASILSNISVKLKQ